ncbi:protein lethal(2)essential for life [Tribolium castaneum]|uniref:Protein lethal(2)essential for life-like Protein n=1 Tax=Tribolium castaneum TaxID=7070 RepID=D6WSJ5_TRICA|nr:PREDICTED: protein lethal(2)essential for life [Tribolium castaneum]EFA07114.1 Protein lethal(2)essential for life-like Protein [Tribolium castaneum]|eukprot:XP_968760.1 PREDICTED: protein lethal(2)essential for life [Tribolium castaneum]
MSVVPLLFRDWWDDDDFHFSRPSRLLDQQFGLGLRRDDLLNTFSSMPRSSLFRNYVRPWRSTAIQRQDSGSTIQQDKDKFQVILDVQQFAPNEITVKTSGNSIIVEGKHEEKQDEHGFISRHFVRRYLLPQDHDINDVVSSLSSDGILTVSAPKKSLQQPAGERVVPITQTGPAKATVTPVAESQPKVEQPN